MAEPAPWEMDWGVPITAPAAMPAAPASAAGGADAHPWQMEWAAPEAKPPGVGADIAKAAGAGLRNAPIAAMTAGPSMWDLGVKGLEKAIHFIAPDTVPDLAMESARHYVERDPAALRAMADRTNDPEMKAHFLGQADELETNPQLNAALKNRMHRFQDVSGAVEHAGVPDYEPQTMPGRYVKGITELAPLALTGNEGAAANVLKGAVAPAVGSEALGDKFKGTWLETPARLAGALLGGGAAHGADVAKSAVKTYGAQREVAKDVGSLIGDSEITPGAVSRMAKSVAADKLTPEAAAARAAELGPESMMLDQGRQLQGRAEAIATQPGVGQNRVLDAVEKRTGEFGDQTAARIKATLDKEMGPSPDVVDLEKKVSNLVDTKAKPLYDKVMTDHPVVEVPAEITSRPAVAAAMKNATTLAKQYGEKLESPTETQTILKGPGYHIAEDTTAPAQTSLRYWDYVKKDMDRRINSYMKSGGTSELNSADKADLGGLIDARNALKSHLDNVTGGAYAQARKVAATKPELREAAEFGRSALNTGLLKEEFADTVDSMSAPQKLMVAAHMRREVDRIIDTARNDGAAARRVLDTNENRAKIEHLFGAKAAQGIDDRIAAETHFQKATQNISANSRTAVRSELRKDTESPSIATPPMANIGGALYTGARTALQNLRNTGMENTRSAIGSMSVTPAAKVPDLVRLLAGYNDRAAGMARPPVGPYAKTLAQVLGINALQTAPQGAEARR
jgi:hypothetical protein